MHSVVKRSFSILACTALISCSTTQQGYQVPSSRIAGGGDYQEEQPNPADGESANSLVARQTFERLPSIRAVSTDLTLQQNTAQQFNNSDSLTVAAEQMPVREFVHTIFGELLQVSYVIAEGMPSIDEVVTLNVQNTVSSRELYLLASKILDSKNVSITKNEDVFFIHPKDGAAKGEVAIGVGRNKGSVPQAAGAILQMVPLRYGMNVSLERTLTELTSVTVTPDFKKNVLFLKGERSEIFRALDLIDLMDVPASRGRFVSILRLTYISPQSYVDGAADLLLAEGINADKTKANQSNLVMVPLEQIGAVALFGSDEFYIERAGFWAGQLDKPSEGAEKRYYIFHPRYARAGDLGASIAGLLGQNAAMGAGNNSRDTRTAGNNQLSTQAQSGASGAVRAGSGSQQGGTLTVQNEDMRMTVDDRSNTIIFYTTGIKYQALLPMIKRLDVMPKQILLEATIAEVTLTDAFSMGLEFGFKNGKLGYGTTKAFGVGDLGGFGLSFIDGADSVIAQLKASNNNVNVLSNPSIVVRDGVNASIIIGDDIPTVGSTTLNPGTETESRTVQYRKTGVDLSVTPTINAQGLVILQIKQKISNQADGSSLDGSPAFFERGIETEVLAQSGQTIMLGGLMSENTSKTLTKVPLLGDLPILGAFFRSEKDSTKKTELVILITPKVIDQPEQWQGIKKKLDLGMQHLTVRD